MSLLELPDDLLVAALLPHLDLPTLLSLCFSSKYFKNIFLSNPIILQFYLDDSVELEKEPLRYLLDECLAQKHFRLLFFFHSELTSTVIENSPYVTVEVIFEEFLRLHGYEPALEFVSPLVIDGLLCSNERLVSAAAFYGDIETLRRISKKLKIPANSFYKAVRNGACEAGRVDVLELIQELNPTFHWNKFDIATLLRLATEYGRLEIVKWAIAKFNVSADEPDKSDTSLFRKAAEAVFQSLFNAHKYNAAQFLELLSFSRVLFGVMPLKVRWELAFLFDIPRVVEIVLENDFRNLTVSNTPGGRMIFLNGLEKVIYAGNIKPLTILSDRLGESFSRLVKAEYENLIEFVFVSKKPLMIQWLLDVIGENHFDRKTVALNYLANFEGKPADVALFSYLRTRFGFLDPDNVASTVEELSEIEANQYDAPYGRHNFSLLKKQLKYDRGNLSYLDSIGVRPDSADLVINSDFLTLSGIRWVIENRPNALNENLIKWAKRSNRKHIEQVLIKAIPGDWSQWEDLHDDFEDDI